MDGDFLEDRGEHSIIWNISAVRGETGGVMLACTVMVGCSVSYSLEDIVDQILVAD